MDAALLEAILAGGAKSGELDPEIQQMQELIQIMRARGEAPEGKMVSGHFVAPSITQHLGSLANNLGSAYQGAQMKDLQKQQGAIRADQNQRVLQALMAQRPNVPGAGAPAAASPYDQFRIGMNT